MKPKSKNENENRKENSHPRKKSGRSPKFRRLITACWIDFFL